MPLLAEQRASVEGEVLTCKAEISVPGAPAPKVMVSALGPQLLKVTGRLCDGTITWMTGPNTIRDLTVPTMRQAAEEAGRPAPEIVSGFPICVNPRGSEQRPGSGRRAASPSTASSRATGRCSIARATTARPIWRWWAARTR